MRQIQHIQDIAVAQFILQRKSQYIEIVDAVPALQPKEFHSIPAHLLFHIHPGGEYTLTPDIVLFIENFKVMLQNSDNSF